VGSAHCFGELQKGGNELRPFALNLRGSFTYPILEALSVVTNILEGRLRRHGGDTD
jgi:hypothetical protein